MISSTSGSDLKGPKADGDKRGNPPLLSEADMLREEEDSLWPDGAPAFRAGLALSGGGVRAATVALGVLQVLAEHDLLARFHYLSTVSGGGYIGSSLSWFWCKKRVEEEAVLTADGEAPPLRFGAEASNFPFQDSHDDPTKSSSTDSIDLHSMAVENLKFLRNHGSYLTSGDGIGFAGLVIAVTRTILLSLAVWLPLLVFLFGVFEVADFFLRGAVTFEKCIADESIARDFLRPFQCRPTYGVLLILAGMLVLVFFAAVILFSFLSRLQLDSSFPGARPRPRYRLIVLYVVCLIGTLVLTVRTFNHLSSVQPLMGVELTFLPLGSAALFMLAIAELLGPANRDYFLRRSFEKYSNFVLPNVLVALFIGAFPLIISSLKPGTGDASTALMALGPLGGVVTLLSGVGTALYGYYLKAKSLLPGIAGQILALAGSLLFLSGLLLSSFVMAGEIFSATQSGNPQSNLVVTIFLSLVLLALLIGMFGSVNGTGLHRFYRDRLMETFMPMTGAVIKGTARKSEVADDLSVIDLQDPTERDNRRPYHLVNAHAILVNDDDAKVALRGGDNFLISSTVVGSSATGWIRTRDYVRHHGALTLASAMAVSGAAANANAGYIGAGITRDRFVSSVMSLLNIRLGLWVGNPRVSVKSATTIVAATSMHDDRFLPRWRTKVATYFRPVLTCGIFGFGHHREATFLELSDGGHFENLGLYELIRRKLDLIVVVDAEQDSNVSLSALVSSTNRIREDFGVTIRFLDSKGPEMLLGKDSDRYPGGVRIAKSPFIAAEINYSGKSQRGVLVYIKSNMMAGLNFATEGYKATNPDFPHQTTLDQFFDPDQFEAYRDLGKKSCATMIGALDLETNFKNTSRMLERYGFQPDQTAAPPISRAEMDHTP